MVLEFHPVYPCIFVITQPFYARPSIYIPIISPTSYTCIIHYTDAVRFETRRYSNSEKTSDALVPPKPKLLDMATLTCFSWAWSGT
jgi:hypothetical protein